ncbi:MAG: D-alanine--D-alanine ligase B [Pseudohongiella sp.]|nr:MAG: D-alanine--D-alanine ligase B [Pseudohongiella sp.]
MKRTINKEEILSSIGKVLVLMGGSSAERQVSLDGGRAVINGLLRMGVQAEVLDVQDGLVSELIKRKPDMVFNMLHGRGGEDGVLQGVLEYLGIPYTGSGVLASALSLDKAKSKQIWLQQGLPTAPFELLNGGSNWQEIIDRLGSVVVKPVNEGSSIGISIVHDAVALANAFIEAEKFDSRVMAEQYIEGGEFSVGVLGDSTLPSIQLETDHQFFDYDAKYVDESTRVTCPAKLTPEKARELDTIVLSAYRSLGCEGLARIDIMQDRDENFFLLEANTIPGMTEHSFLPHAASVAGMSFDDLLLRILTAKSESQSVE